MTARAARRASARVSDGRRCIGASLARTTKLPSRLQAHRAVPRSPPARSGTTLGHGKGLPSSRRAGVEPGSRAWTMGPMIAGQLRFGRAARWRCCLSGSCWAGGRWLSPARRRPARSPVAPAAALAGLVAGWSLVGAGLAALGPAAHQPLRATARGAGLVWFLAGWDNPGVGVPMAFTAGLVLHAACPALVGQRRNCSRRAAAVPSGMGRGGDCL